MAADTHWTAGSHPTPEQLLLACEDELPREEADSILAHIHHCWQCRAHVERYNRGIDAYLKFREARIDPAFTPPSGGWLCFSARLRAVSVLTIAGDGGFWKRVPKTVWAASFAAAVAIVIAAFLIAPANLTAAAVFDRAIRAESGQSTPFLQQVFVRRAGRLLAVDDRLLRAAYIERAHPLSVASFRSWHDSLRSRQDAVTRSEDEIRIETTTPEGAISLARLTVAQASYRPRAKHIELRDGITIDVEAVAAAAPRTTPPVAPTVRGPVPDAPPDTSAAEREALEVEVRWALHRIDADLGELITIRAEGDRVAVSGTLDDAARRDQITAALSAFPRVAMQLSVAQADTLALATALPIAPGSGGGGPLLASRLLRDLPDADARRLFVSAALHGSQDILRHSWALHRLAGRYPLAAETGLPSGAQTSLRQLVAAHHEAIRIAARDAAESWKPFVALDSQAGSRIAWQSGALAALPYAQAFDHFTTRLLAAGGNDGLTGPEALRQLHNSYQQLLLALPREIQ